MYLHNILNFVTITADAASYTPPRSQSIYPPPDLYRTLNVTEVKVLVTLHIRLHKGFLFVCFTQENLNGDDNVMVTAYD